MDLGEGWEVFLNDPELSSQAFKLSRIDVLQKVKWNLDELFLRSADIFWQAVKKNGKLSRRSSWYTIADCSCVYSYGHGKPLVPNEFEDWMYTLCEDIKDMANLENLPNAINFNDYDGKTHHLGFHSDDEELFPDHKGECEIVSLSLGAMREFKIKKKYTSDNTARATQLCNGDVLIMRGKMQQPYDRAVAQGLTDAGRRINLTFRFIRKENPKCKCHGAPKKSSKTY
jgi:alkylated DNA repair dioxygenase AlkB